MSQDFDKIIQEFVGEKLKQKLKEIISTNKSSVLVNFDEIDDFSPELGDYFLIKPEEALDSMKSAITDLSQLYRDLNLDIRIRNLPENAVVLIRNIRSRHIERFIQVTGLIKLAASVKPVAETIDFECNSCGHVIKVLQKERTINSPTICTNCGKKGLFKIMSKKLIDTQRIVLEEAPEDLEGGAQPEHVDIMLKNDLVDPKFERNIIPGNKVTVSGIVNEAPIFYPSGKKSRTSDIFIEASYLEAVNQDFEDITITKEEEATIKELAKDKLVYSKFRESIAPNIFGHDYIKEAIVLQLLGGVRKIRTDGGSAIRGDLHILLVGDPGTAKSSLLKYVQSVAPKARYVTGMGSSAAGLTATIIKDEATRSYILEAGALPLTNRGTICIDELDKMNKDDRVAMHEALEQQSISISKANIHATLSAQTSVLGAANPKLGRFNPFETVAQQIDLPPTLINRFDLIFVIKDRPNKETDKLIADRILESNKDIDKLKPPIKKDLFKKYIAFAKQNCKPKISDEAMKTIEDFYLNLRSQTSTEGEGVRSVPISARQLEAIIRLTEASAKLRLSEFATVEDAKRAIDITMAYLSEVGFDRNTGQLDIDRIASGISSSQRGIILSIKSIIKKEIETLPSGSTLPIQKVYDDAVNVGIPKDKVDEAISVLKREGDIFEPKANFLKML